MKTFVIAEAGVNHNGSLEMAKKLVDAAKSAGADAVKFQTFKTENLVTKRAKQTKYQIDNLGTETSQYEMLKALELTFEEFIELKMYCDLRQIVFLSTPFDFESADFLFDNLGIGMAKIPSGELTNTPFVFHIATKKKPIILSTGMAAMDDIHEALAFIAYGLSNNRPVDIERVKDFYHSEEAQELLKQYVTVLHCTSEYPTPFESINLLAINEMKSELNLSIGYSDHSEGIVVPIAAAAMGATVIEKHFTLDRNLPGPDHLTSLEPDELAEMVKCVRTVEKSMGNGIKKPTSNEMENRMAARKSIVAKVPIHAGEILSEKQLTIKRPGNGMPPTSYWTLLGKSAKKSYEVDDLLDE